MRTATICNVTHSADNDIPASIRRVVVCCKRIMAVVTSFEVYDGAIVIIVKVIAAEVKGSGRGIDCAGSGSSSANDIGVPWRILNLCKCWRWAIIE